VWPFCRPKPFTSVTVIPCTPIDESASRTSSSLNGLMMAVTSFMFSPEQPGAAWRARRFSLLSERLADREHDRAVAGVLELRAPLARLTEAVELGAPLGRATALGVVSM
jgi:hypothetical protein